MWGATPLTTNTTHHYVWFQFTHPVWGATPNITIKHKLRRFNSRTPCGVRHRPHSTRLHHHGFQFTHPVWGATRYTLDTLVGLRVSIHAPRVGCDSNLLSINITLSGFNSRTPCGVRLRPSGGGGDFSSFNSRTPCGVRPVRGYRLQAVPLCFNSRTPCGVRPRCRLS